MVNDNYVYSVLATAAGEDRMAQEVFRGLAAFEDPI